MIRIENLIKLFGPKKAVDNISFTVAKVFLGCFLAFPETLRQIIKINFSRYNIRNKVFISLEFWGDDFSYRLFFAYICSSDIYFWKGIVALS